MGTFTTKDGKTVTLPDRKPKAAPAPVTERTEAREEGGGGGVLLALGGLVLLAGLGAAVYVFARRRAAAPPALAAVPDAPADVVVEDA